MKTGADIPPGLILVHGNRAEDLRELLMAWVGRHPLAPLEYETVLVQSNGIAQWLKLSMAADGSEGGCGVAAGWVFSLPSRFVWQVYRAVLGRQAVPEISPLDKSRLVWRLMRLLPGLMAEPLYAPLAHFLGEQPDLRKVFQLAERLADLFDQYQVYRADWLEAWDRHQDVLLDARGGAAPLAGEDRWQPDLWRRIQADILGNESGDVTGAGGRAGVHGAFLARARATPSERRPPGLPRRVMVFGISSLPRQSLEVLEALSRWAQVLICVPNPCEHYWADIVSGQDLLRAAHARQGRKQGYPGRMTDTAFFQHAHPLLAAWGKQGRDFIALLDEHDDPIRRARHGQWLAEAGQRIDLFVSPGEDTLLHQIQADILALRPGQEILARQTEVDPEADRSIRFHVAHGHQREVEILHDCLLAAFDADPGLRPRDVIVMVPDMEAYKPHIEAVFGLPGRSDPRFIPYTIADRNPRAADPLVESLAVLLAVPQSRLEASLVLDLLEVPAIRARFGVEAADLPLIQAWVRGAHVRWGLHDGHRHALGLPDLGEGAPHTWLSGLQRMLLGYAAGRGAPDWMGIEPYGDVGGLAAARLGPLIQMLASLEETWRTFQNPVPPAQWVTRLRALLADYYAAEGEADAYTLDQLDAILVRWQEACQEAGLVEPLPLSIVAEHWLAELETEGLGQPFLAGAVTFATLMPMRAIPFRRICLLGMDDGAYPRVRKPVDFDLMGRDYWPGDRSRREDDRYLFLEALLAAPEHLHISWVGRSIRDNGPRPPSVLVAQLRDHLRTGWRLPGGDGADLVQAITIHHPLQPFAQDYFQPGPARLFTYAREWQPDSAPAHANANASANAEAPADAAPLAPPLLDEALELSDLVRFLADPVRYFFQERLGVYFQTWEVPWEDYEPFELDGLERWSIQQELIQTLVRADPGEGDIPRVLETAWQRLARRGVLPPGGFGATLALEMMPPVSAMLDSHRKYLARWPQVLEERWPLALEVQARGTGWAEAPPVVLSDILEGVRQGQGEAGPTLACIHLDESELVRNGRYRRHKIIRHWVRHLAFQVAVGPVTTVVVSAQGTVTLTPQEAASARAHLEALLVLWQQGMTRPLPWAAQTAFEWLHARLDADPARAHAAAALAYEGTDRQPGEVSANPYLARAYPDYGSLVASGEFMELAERILEPLARAIPVQAREYGNRRGSGS